SDMLPNIKPDVNQTVIQTGENIELMCSATEPIHWLYPQAVIKERFPRALYIHCSVHSLNLALGHFYQVPAVRNCIETVTSVGNFVRASAQQTNILKENLLKKAPASKRTTLTAMCDTRYSLSFADEDNLIAYYEQNPWLKAKQYGDVLIPCRPSSPDVRMELYRDQILVDRSSLKEESMEIEYDPTEGFTLHHLDMNNNYASYECVAKLGYKDSKRTVYMTVLRHTSSAPKPWMSDTEGMHVEVGDNFTLECWVDIASDIKHSIKWIYPNINEQPTLREQRIYGDQDLEKTAKVPFAAIRTDLHLAKRFPLQLSRARVKAKPHK
ncbi:unnamed protein product, partial [Timema podura]|nr:unnamed protein product [Timema podura]